jgi:hypothetical protein
MKAFIEGMGRFGLHLSRKKEESGAKAAWRRTGLAFAKTGNNMRRSIITLGGEGITQKLVYDSSGRKIMLPAGNLKGISIQILSNGTYRVISSKKNEIMKNPQSRIAVTLQEPRK